MIILTLIIVMTCVAIYKNNRSIAKNWDSARILTNNYVTNKGDAYEIISKGISKGIVHFAAISHSISQGTSKAAAPVFIRCDSAINIDLSLGLEMWYDRFLKQIGFDAKQRVENEEFDNSFYITNCDSAVLNAIKNSPLIQKDLLAILDFCKSNNLVFRELNFSGRLILFSSSNTGFLDANLIAERLVPLFLSVSNQFKEYFGGLPQAQNKIRNKSENLLSASQASWAGFYYIIYKFYACFPQIVGDTSIVRDSFFVGAALTLLNILLVFVMLGVTANFSKTVTKVIAFGFVGFFAGAFAVLSTINIDYDNSKAVSTNVAVYHKRSDNGYQISIASATYNYGEITVNGSIYKTIGDFACIKERAGYLGYRWIEKIDLKECSW